MDDKNKDIFSDGLEELDFESFFGSFDDLENEEPAAPAKPAAPAAPAAEKAPAAPAAPKAPEPAEAPAVPAFNLSFIEDAKKDIDAMLASLDEPEKESKKSNLSSLLNNEAPQPLTPSSGKTPSVSFAPEAGTGFDIEDLPSYVLGGDDSGADDIFSVSTGASPAIDSSVAEARKKLREAEENQEPKKEKNKAETIRKTVFILSIITIVVSLGVLGKLYFLDPYLSSSAEQKAEGDLIGEQELPSGTTESKMWKQLKAEYPDVEFAADMQIKYAKLYAQNTDLAGWISIEPFGINMPLAQGDDNDYYLKRSIYKQYTTYGVPFFDYRNNLYFLDRNTIVFGHNMRYSDKIFGMLEDYKTIDGFKRAPVIQCNTIYEDYTWKVYAVFLTNSEAKDDNGYVFNYTFTKLSNEKFADYIKEVDERALYTTGVDICETDQILTLSTCCYDFDSAKLVVIGRLLRDGESAEVDTSLAEKNPNPRYPQAWYDANNKSNPYYGADKWFA